MSHCRRNRHNGIAGFTLIEVLVATVLMGMILAALATVTGQWLPGWDHGVARLQRAELLSVSLERVAADLAAAEFIAPDRKISHPFFDGSALSVTFVRSAIGPNTRGGLEVVRISETADQRGPVVVRSHASFAPGEAAFNQLNFTDPVALMHAPYRLSFSYAGRDKVWKAAWHDQAQLPQAIRLTVRDAATDRPLAISSAIVVHAELPAECAGPRPSQLCGNGTDASPQPRTPDNEMRASQ